jgi:hypothetical protein
MRKIIWTQEVVTFLSYIISDDQRRIMAHRLISRQTRDHALRREMEELILRQVRGRLAFGFPRIKWRLHINQEGAKQNDS